MPQLAAGTYKVQNNKLRPGFTLLEILVVVLIIGIVISFAVLFLGNFFKSNKVKNTAKELNILLPFVSQKAILQPAVLGLKFTSTKYEFYLYAQNTKKQTSQWKLITRDSLLAPHNIPYNIKITIKPTSKNDQPQIVFLPSGNNTPFSIMFSNNNKAPFYKVEGDSQGGFKLAEVGR